MKYLLKYYSINVKIYIKYNKSSYKYSHNLLSEYIININYNILGAYWNYKIFQKKKNYNTKLV